MLNLPKTAVFDVAVKMSSMPEWSLWRGGLRQAAPLPQALEAELKKQEADGG